MVMPMAQPIVPSIATAAALAEAIEAGFQAAAAIAVKDAHEAGLAVPVLGVGDKIAWLPPDRVSTFNKRRA